MVKRYFDDSERFESVKECLEAAIEKEGIRKCYYYFTANGNCSIDLFESTRAHSVEPKEMVNIAEKFFNEFGWVSFEGLGKNGKAYVSCYLADETEESFYEKQIQRDKEKKQKLLSEYKEKKCTLAEIATKYRTIEEWKET